MPQRRLALAQAQLDARLERRQRRAQLVGGVGDELCLALELLAQALGEVVERGHQRAQLILHLNHRQRLQVVRLALFHRRAQALQRAQRGTHRQPHQGQGDQCQQAHAPQGIEQQATGHAHAGHVGLGHADFRHAVHPRLGNRLQQADQAHADAIEFTVIEARQRRIVIGTRRALRRRRQTVVAGHHAPLKVADLVEDAPLQVIGEGVQRHVGNVGAQLAILGVEPVGDGPRRGQQGAIVGRVGGMAAIPVGAEAADQQRNGQQDGQPTQQPATQAARRQLSHRWLPAGSPGHGR